MRDMLIIAAFLLSVNLLFSQRKDFKKIETELISDFKVFQEASYEDRYKVFSPKFREKMKHSLSIQESFQHAFDSLSNHIKIVTSPDQKIRLFSWDELGGGSWHDMTVLIQYKNGQNQVKTQYIDTDEFNKRKGYTNAILHSLYTLEINQKPYYLALGWGTYGGGQHHGDVLIFSVENGVFKNCFSCLPEEYSEINASRSSKIELAYNEKQHLISFNKFLYDEEMGFYQPTGDKVYLKLIEGTFRAIKN